MLTEEENKKLKYPKIETLFDRDAKWKVDTRLVRKPEFKLIKKWEVSEKIDGTNVTVEWKDSKINFIGKTEKSELPNNLMMWLYEKIYVDKMLYIFGDEDISLHGEGYGRGIQANNYYSDEAKFIIYDIKRGDIWLNREEVEYIASKLEIDTVPYLGEMTIEEITDLVSKGFSSKIFFSKIPICEGIVARTNPNLFDSEGNRLIFKLKHKDFKR